MSKCVWQKDEDVTNCCKCNIAFSFWVRRHHCRNCGRIFCNNCSSKMCVIPGGNSNNSGTSENNLHRIRERVCDACYLHITSTQRERKAKFSSSGNQCQVNYNSNKNNNVKTEQFNMTNDTISSNSNHLAFVGNNANVTSNATTNVSSNELWGANKQNNINFIDNKEYNPVATAEISRTNDFTREKQNINVDNETDTYKAYYEACYKEQESILHQNSYNAKVETDAGAIVNANVEDSSLGRYTVQNNANETLEHGNNESKEEIALCTSNKTLVLEERLRNLREVAPFYEVGVLYVNELSYDSVAKMAEDDLQRFQTCASTEEVIEQCFAFPQTVDNSVACLWQPVGTTVPYTSLELCKENHISASEQKELLDDITNIVHCVSM